MSYRRRAEYMRQYRAAKNADKTRARTCVSCGDEYTPARADSRYCSASCKGHGYRSRRTVTHEINPAGFVIPANESRAGELRTCFHNVNGVFCPAVATVATTSWHHHTRHLKGAAHWCDEHAPSRYDYSVKTIPLKLRRKASRWHELVRIAQVEQPT